MGRATRHGAGGVVRPAAAAGDPARRAAVHPGSREMNRLCARCKQPYHAHMHEYRRPESWVRHWCPRTKPPQWWEGCGVLPRHCRGNRSNAARHAHHHALATPVGRNPRRSRCARHIPRRSIKTRRIQGEPAMSMDERVTRLEDAFLRLAGTLDQHTAILGDQAETMRDMLAILRRIEYRLEHPGRQRDATPMTTTDDRLA